MTLKTPSRTACTLSAGLLLLTLVTVFADRLSATHPNDEKTTKLVCDMIQRYHISQRRIDDKISEKLLERFLKNLDPQKMYFTQSDIAELSKEKSKLGDLLKAGNTQFAYDAFDLYLQRVDRRIELVHKLIDEPHDFTVDEWFDIDPDKITYAADEKELNDRWRKRIKLELLNLKLDNTAEPGKPDDGKPKKSPAIQLSPKERLDKRYKMFQKEKHETEDAEKLEMYLSSLTHCFDPHSSYMSPQLNEEFKIAIALSLEGIGAALRSEDGYTTVNEVVKDGAADKDGRLKAGDRIVAVSKDGEMVDIMEMKLSKIVRLIRGKSGTKVRLQIKKADTGEDAVYELTRQKIELRNAEVKGEIIETEKRLNGRKGRVGVINIPSFYRDFEAFQRGDENAKSTARDVEAALKKFQNKDGVYVVDAVVVDLRTNGGGALSEAIDVSGLFIDKGPVVQVKTQNGEIKSHDDEINGVVYDGPLIVLCNKLSASASEIFAGVIKDYQRGIVVGDETTHGKGTVQNVIPVTSTMLFLNNQDRGALKLTIQQFYRVNGESTQNLGVKSDVVLPSLLDHMDLGESSLENALAFDKIAPAPHASAGMVTNDLISHLQSRSERRRAAEPKFQEIKKDIERYIARKNRKSISLNESVIKAERALDKKEQAEAEKLEDPTSRGDQPIFPPEAYNDELLQISLDYTTLLRNPQAAQK